MSDDHRLLILSIKQAMLLRSQAGRVPSALVYAAVMDHGVVDVTGFQAWLRATGETVL